QPHAVRRLDPGATPDDQELATLATWRSLAIVLSALDTRVWPYITRRVHHDVDAWRMSRLAMSATDLLAWLGTPPDTIRQEAERLLIDSSFDDVLGDFYDIVRRAKPTAWASLRG